MVEAILKSNKEEYDNMVSDSVKMDMIKSNTAYGKFNINELNNKPSSIDSVYNELIQLRHKNRALEGRIKQLET